MLKNKILFNLTALTLAELIKKAMKVAKGVENNIVNFPNLNPTLSEFRAEADNLDSLLEQKDALESELLALRQKIKIGRENLTAMIKVIGTQVVLVADQKQDEILIQSCGFDLRSEKTPTTALSVPDNLRLQEVSKTSGMLSVVFDSVDKARNYGLVWAYGDSSPVQWPKTAMLIIAGSRNNKISFERGQTVWVRVKAYGPNNTESDWSDVATRVVP